MTFNCLLPFICSIYYRVHPGCKAEFLATVTFMAAQMPILGFAGVQCTFRDWHASLSYDLMLQEVDFEFGREQLVPAALPTTFAKATLSLAVIFLNSAVDATGAVPAQRLTTAQVRLCIPFAPARALSNLSMCKGY